MLFFSDTTVILSLCLSLMLDVIRLSPLPLLTTFMLMNTDFLWSRDVSANFSASFTTQKKETTENFGTTIYEV